MGSAVDMGMNLICSTGMSTQQEVIETSQFLKDKGALFYFLHCQSSYPAAIKDIAIADIKVSSVKNIMYYLFVKYFFLYHL